MDAETLAKDLIKAIMPEINRAHESALAEIDRLKAERDYHKLMADNHAVRVCELEHTTKDALAWMDERARNSTSHGSHCHAYEVAARKLREALHERT